MKKQSIFPFVIILISALSIISCNNTHKTDLLSEQLILTNEIIAENSNEIYPLVEQIFYKRCKHTNNFRKEILEFSVELNENIKQADSLYVKKSVTKSEFLYFLKNYNQILRKLKTFTENIKEWKVNSYKLYFQDYSVYKPQVYKEVFLKMKNDLLLIVIT